MDFSFVTGPGPSKKKSEEATQQQRVSGGTASTARPAIAIPSFHEVQAAQQPTSNGFGNLFKPKGLVSALQQQRQGEPAAGAGSSGQVGQPGSSGDVNKRIRTDGPSLPTGPRQPMPATTMLQLAQPSTWHQQQPPHASSAAGPPYNNQPPAQQQQLHAGPSGAHQLPPHTAPQNGAQNGRPYGAPPPTTGGSTGSYGSAQGGGQPHVSMPANAILVSNRQRGNPVLKHIRNVKWVHADIGPDYQLGVNTCALFLSLRYHLLHPDYIMYRIKELQRAFALRVLLVDTLERLVFAGLTADNQPHSQVHVDVEDAAKPLGDVTRAALLNDCTLICAWSPEECARYLETFKAYETKPASSIQERVEADYVSRLTSVLTAVRGVNKTDALTMSSVLGPLSAVMSARPEELSACPGLGPTKVQRLVDAFHQPFRLPPPSITPPQPGTAVAAPDASTGPAATAATPLAVGPAPAAAPATGSVPHSAAAGGGAAPTPGVQQGPQAASTGTTAADISQGTRQAQKSNMHEGTGSEGVGEQDEEEAVADLVVMATQMMVQAGAAALHADVGREHDDLMGSDADDDDEIGA